MKKTGIKRFKPSIDLFKQVLDYCLNIFSLFFAHTKLYLRISKIILMNFNLSQIPERVENPGKNGLTMVMDKGLSLEEGKNLISAGASTYRHY